MAIIQEPYVTLDTGISVPYIPPGYVAFHSLDRDHAYGAMIIVRLAVAHEGRAVNRSKNNFTAAVDVKLPGGPLRIVSLYIRHSCPNPSSVLHEAVSALRAPNMLLGLDSNCRSTLWNSIRTDRRGTDLVETLLELDLSILNANLSDLEFAPPGTSFVDLTLALGRVSASKWHYPLHPSLTDHPLIYFEICLAAAGMGANHRGCPSHRQKTPRAEQIDCRAFLDYIAADVQQDAPTLVTMSDVEGSITGLVNSIITAARRARKHDPRPSTRNMPWWNSALSELRDDVRDAYRLWSVQKTTPNRISFSLCKSRYQRELRIAKKRSWHSLCEEQSGSELYSTLELLSGKLNRATLPPVVEHCGVTLSEPEDILEAAVKHFFPEEPPSNHGHAITMAHASSALGENLPNTSHSSITSSELRAAATSLNRKAAPGHDGIGMDLIVLSLSLIEPILLAIMNALIQLQSFPPSWKTVIVEVIGKVGKKAYTTLDAFRPISLVSNLSKLLEKVLLNRLRELADQHSWFSSNQHGFRAKRSTESAGHALVSFIEKAHKSKLVTACAFLDIKSAFDAAWHPAIIAALVKKGCPQYLVRLVYTFLRGRTAILTHGGASRTHLVNLGCPQGGVLSPFLWCVLIDDVLQTTYPFMNISIGYADDLTIATATRNLQVMCNRVSEWYQPW